MDVYRYRIGAPPSSPVSSLATSSSPVNGKEWTDTTHLAVGRTSGEIEIWSFHAGKWNQQQTLGAVKGRTIEGLAWVHDRLGPDTEALHAPLLLSIGNSSSLTAWNLDTGRPLWHVDIGHGTIWSLSAAPPRDIAEDSVEDEDEDHDSDRAPSIALGCDDGTLVVAGATTGGLQIRRLVRSPARRHARILSLLWLDHDSIVSGQANGQLRSLSATNRVPPQSATIAADSGPASSHVSIWSISRLSNARFATADSRGVIEVWTATGLDLLQRIQAHEGDAFALQSGLGGTSLFSVGMDRRSILYEQREDGRWHIKAKRRFHSHDVRALTSYSNAGKEMIISGGVDGAPMTLPFGHDLQHLQPERLNSSDCRCITKQRMGSTLALSWHTRRLELWQVASSDGGRRTGLGSDSLQKLFSITTRSDEYISCADVSTNGRLLAMATIHRIQLFHVPLLDGTLNPGSSIRRIQIPSKISRYGARMLRLSLDGTWLLFVTQEHKIVIARRETPGSCFHRERVGTGEGAPEQRRQSRWTVRHVARQHDQSPVQCIEFSRSGQLFAVATSSGAIMAWRMTSKPRKIAGSLEHSNQLSGSPSSTHSSNSAMSGSGDAAEWDWVSLASFSGCPRLDGQPAVLRIVDQQEFEDDRDLGSGSRSPDSPMPRPRPSDETAILVLTAAKEAFLIDLRTGRLSPWCSQEQRRLRAQVLCRLEGAPLDCLLDQSGTNGLLWVFGPCWVFALTLQGSTASRQAKVNDTQRQVQVGKGGGPGEGVKAKRKTDGIPDPDMVQDSRVPGIWLSRAWKGILAASLVDRPAQSPSKAPTERNASSPPLLLRHQRSAMVVFQQSRPSRRQIGDYPGTQNWRRDF